MEFEKKHTGYKVFMAVIVTALITFIVTTIGIYNYFTKTDNGNLRILTKYITTSDSTNTLKTKLEIVRRYLERNYIGDLNEDKMLENAVKGYVQGVGDEYTEYLTKDEYEDLMINVNGNYVGIGLYMAKANDGRVIILMPIEDSPAEEAGLKSGDIISKINDEECESMDLALVANKIKGEEGTTVNLEIIREEETLNFTVARRRIELKYIDSSVLEGNIGYIRLLSFDDGSSEKFKEHLENLKAKNIKSLIIDVRDNGGGLVDEAISLSEIFVPKDKVILRSYDKENKEQVEQSSNSKPETLKLIVLVNENSASAAEIFASAIKDNNVGKIVGTTTFGKGVMQELVELATGGALKITIEEFKTPNGDKINRVGIAPDVEVKNDKEADDDSDAQLEKAIELLR